MIRTDNKNYVMPRFEYICYHNTDKGYVIDGFTLYANIISKTDEVVTYQRYLDFGKIKSDRATTVSIKDFEKYYQPITDEIYEQCVDALKKEKI